MVALPEPFDPNAVEPNDRNFEAFPAGKYRLQVVESTITETRTGTGELLTLTLEVIDGPYAGRKMWDRLNWRNVNPDAQRIASQALSNLCLLIGIHDQLRDSEQLHYKPFIAQVIIEQDKSGVYLPQNRVRYPNPQGSGGQPQKGPQPGAQRAAGAPARGVAPAGNAAQRPASAAKPWNQPQQRQTSGPDDEIPF